MESGDKELTEGRRDLGRGAKEVKEKRVCVDTHTHTHLVVWSWGTSALVRVTGNERLVGLKSITTATASHNPIPSHPTQELRAAWLARSPWGTEAATQALSAYSLCQLWLRVCVQRASRALKERLAHFGRRRCELCRRTPTVSVSVCAALPVWEEQATLNRYRLFCPGFSDSLNLVMKVCLPTIFFFLVSENSLSLPFPRIYIQALYNTKYTGLKFPCMCTVYLFFQLNRFWFWNYTA